MRILRGTLALKFQGQTFDCPMAGVRGQTGQVEVAVAMPFGLRRVNARLDVTRRIMSAHTFAFDYETGELTRFELTITGGPRPENRRIYDGSVCGGGLEGQWTITELGPFDDEEEEAAHAFGVGARVPDELTPAPARDGE